MEQESLSHFPSEADRDINRTAVTVLARALPSLPPGHARTSARTPVVIVAAIAILGMTGLALLRPTNSAPSDTPNPVAVSSPLVPAVEAAAVQPMPVQSAPSIEAVVPTRAPVPAPARPAPTAPRTREVGSRAAAAKAPAYTGTLIVHSVPQGAAVLINQRHAGITPLRLADYPAGSYAVWVEREGFQRWTAGVRVTADTTTLVNPILRSERAAAGTTSPAQ